MYELTESEKTYQSRCFPGECSIKKDWYGDPHPQHLDGHECTEFPEFHMDTDGSQWVDCGLCGFLLQVS